MPLDGSAGFSEWTVVKQAHFERSFRMIERVAGNCADKHDGQLIVLDLTAGPAIVDGQRGSPLIIADTLAERDRAARAWFFERDREAASLLRDRLRPYHDPEHGRHYRVLRGDHAIGVSWFLRDVLPGLRGPLYGVIYVDANRRTQLSFDALAALARAPKLASVDLLLNVAATSWWKRIRAVGKSDRYFYDDIKALQKQCRWFREPVGPPQWTMIWLSNWAKLPAPRKSGFHAEDSPSGQEILMRLNQTKHERRADIQPMLPFGPPPTEPMASTFGIRSIAPSGPMPSPDVEDAVSAVAFGA